MTPILPLTLLATVLCASGELGRIEIAEPLSRDWDHEWVTREVTIDTGSGNLPVRRLQVETTISQRVQEGGKKKTVEARLVVPAQFYHARTGRLLTDEDAVGGSVKVLLAASLRKDKTQVFAITDGRDADRPWQPVAVRTAGSRTVVSNGLYEVELDSAAPLPINAIRLAGGKGTMGRFAWPAGVKATGVTDEWLERGPARSILRRRFAFADAPADTQFVLQLDFRAGDAWIDLADDSRLGAGSFLRLDLAELQPDFVYHPHSYNARTFKPDGKAEDSTLQPPQHPIATLGPIWRDIWFGGGPVAFVYSSMADRGLGLAAVRGSEWLTDDGVSPESQNLFVHGDADTPGKVWVQIPTEGIRSRRWALAPGPAELRKRMEHLVRVRADVPLQSVLDEWVLTWDSKHPDHSYGFAGQWFGTFNRHILNPTTFPRNVRKHLGELIEKGAKVRSRDLAMLAYVFADADYWPGPKYKWAIGNPNFNTDMYNVVLQIGLIMPDHPHAGRWVAHGVNELKTNVYRDSFPGGAWAESISYSGFFFHIAEYADLLGKAGAAQPFRDWPRIKEVLNYLACMHTPVDPRYASRQKAPIGDTSAGNYVKELHAAAEYYRGLDESFAEQLARYGENWPGALDISSREFFGFGAMMRGNAYDDRHESFVTVKAGPARNHYQGDELSFFFAGLGCPLAIDYACHYSPRPWSAAIHNRPNLGDVRPVGLAVRRAFRKSPVADLFVADEKTRRINHVPMEPHLATKPGWNYEWSDLPAATPWVVRRYALLVKHDPKVSRIADYLVIRDEIDSPDVPWWNLHVLARDIKPAGQTVAFAGQLDVDLTVHFIAPPVGEIQKRRWGWGGSMNDRRGLKGADYEKACFGRYVPEDFQRGTWKDGEMAQWLRVKGEPGRSEWLAVLMPNRRGQAAAKVEKLSPTSARITLGDETETIHLGTAAAPGQAAVQRGGKTTLLLKPAELKPPADLDFTPIPPDTDQGAL